MTQQLQEPAEATDRASVAPVGAVRALALVGAALALVFYLLGFVSDVGTTDLVGALVIGGGLLAGTAALPRAGRWLAPAAVVVTVGMLSLLQVVASSRGGALLIGALIVAFLQTVAVVGALLTDAGIVGGSEKRQKRQVDHIPAPSQEYSPDQAWLGQPDPPLLASAQQAGARGAAPSDVTMTYRPQSGGPGQPPYPAQPDATAVVPAAASGGFPVGQSGAGPAFGQAAASAQGPATEVVPVYGLAGAAERGPSAAGPSQAAPGDAPTPMYGLTGADAVNGASAPERSHQGAAHSSAADAQVTLFGPPNPAGAAGERDPSVPTHAGQTHGVPGDAAVPLYGLSGASAPGVVNGRPMASGPSHTAPADAAAPQFGPTVVGGPGGAGERGQSGQAHGVPGDAPVPLYGLSGAGASGVVNGRATASGPSHAASNEGSVPQFGQASGAAGPVAAGAGAAAGQRGQSGSVPGSAPLYGQSGAGAPGTSNAGATGSGPAHAAPTGSTPAAAAYGSSATGTPAVQRKSPSSSGAHHAPTGELPVFGHAGANGAGSPTSGTYRVGQAAAGEVAPPSHGRSGGTGRGSSNGGPAPSGSGSHHAPAPGNRGDAAAPPRGGAAPAGRDASGEAAIPMYGLSSPPNSVSRSPGPGQVDQGRAKPDTSSDTTAFRAQPAGTASDATPAFGHTPFDGGDATMVAPPGWIGGANGSTGQPGQPPEPEPTTRAGRHGSSRKGRHGQPDDASDSTRVFPNPER
jgi:hypothetical protein